MRKEKEKRTKMKTTKPRIGGGDNRAQTRKEFRQFCSSIRSFAAFYFNSVLIPLLILHFLLAAAARLSRRSSLVVGWWASSSLHSLISSSSVNYLVVLVVV